LGEALACRWRSESKLPRSTDTDVRSNLHRRAASHLGTRATAAVSQPVRETYFEEAINDHTVKKTKAVG
jgi:hypothetical protein